MPRTDRADRVLVSWYWRPSPATNETALKKTLRRRSTRERAISGLG
jgi:hypothetical protein